MKVDKKEFLLNLLESNGGVLTPDFIVEAARPYDSPIHNSFEWEDGKAAEEFRLWQARRLIKIEVTFIQGKETRLFRSVQVQLDNGEIQKGYVTVNRVLDTESFYSQTIKDATSRLRYWEQEYQNITELSGVINEEKLKAVELSLGKDTR